MARFNELAFKIFWRKPLKTFNRQGLEPHHLAQFYRWVYIVFLAGWVVPWVGILGWWTVIVNGCSSQSTRDSLGSFCLGPYRSAESRIPWYLNLWEIEEASNRSAIDLPSKVENIGISHLKMCNIETALGSQVAKIKALRPETVPDELLTHMSPVISATSDLCSRLEAFSLQFCVEKDIMNHAFRSFVEAYSLVISRTTYVNVSPLVVAFFPTWHALRLINQVFLLPILPRPGLYSSQVRSEIRYHRKEFIRESKMALQRIDESSHSCQHACANSSLPQSLKKARDTITRWRLLLDGAIRREQDGFFLRRFFFKPKSLRLLRFYHDLSIRMEDRVQEIMETVEAWEAHNQKLMRTTHLSQSFDYVPSFEFSPTGVIAVPASLATQVAFQDPPFIWQEQSRKDPALTGLDGKPTVLYYDLDETDQARVSSLRSTIGQLCRERSNIQIISGSLYTICSIWAQAMAMSELDDDVLGSVQRSWMMARLEAIKRYEQEVGADWDSLVDLVTKRGPKPPQ